MRKGASILLIGILLLSTVFRFGILLNFTLNKEYIAANLCENRLDKKSCCKGSCYLAKQLKKVENEKCGDAKHHHHSNKVDNKTQDLISHNLFFDLILTPNFGDISSKFSYYNSQYSFSFVSSIFHPPSILSLLS